MAQNNRDKRLLTTLRNLSAQGFTDEDTLVDTAADVIGGGETAKKAAQSVYDKHFKIFGAN